jgi:hypothetical protein
LYDNGCGSLPRPPSPMEKIAKHIDLEEEEDKIGMAQLNSTSNWIKNEKKRIIQKQNKKIK